ncbi:MAG: hypothetical protein V1755_08185, partial [Chloroflexota bacterium]
GFVLVLAAWAMLAQLFFLANVRLPDGMIAFLVHSGRPLRVIYGTLLLVVAATFVLPAWAVMRSGRGLRFVGQMIERLGLLAMFYLVFDVVALVIVVVRNL